MISNIRYLLSKYSRVFYCLVIVLGLILVVIVFNRTAAQKPAKGTNTINNAMSSQPKRASQQNSLTLLNLPNEKLHLYYPTNWDETSGASPNASNNNISPGTDNVVITSPGNLQVTILTGLINPPITFNNVLSTQPITTLGSSYYLDFYNDHQSTGGVAEGACVADSPNTQTLLPITKNISSNSTLYNEICLNYPVDESGSAFESTVSNFEKDQSFQQALSIVKSISY